MKIYISNFSRLKNIDSGWWRWVLAFVLAVGIVWHWQHQLRDFNWSLFTAQIFQAKNLPLFLIVLLLMPINWWLETQKFRLLLRPYHAWSFHRALRAVLIGLGAGSLTPNRLGDFAGRAVVAGPAEVRGVLVASFWGGICQWLGFLLVAWPGLVWVGGEALPAGWQNWRWWLLPLGPLTAIGLWVFVLPRVGRLAGGRLDRWCSRNFAFWQSSTFRDSPSGNAHHPRKSKRKKPDLVLPVGLSILRLLIYCTQIYVLLCLGGLLLPYPYAMAGIAGVYLLQAGLPLPPGVHLLVRAELMATLFGGEDAVLLAGMTAFGLLYLVNVLLPALFSPYLLFQNKHRDATKPL